MFWSGEFVFCGVMQPRPRPKARERLLVFRLVSQIVPLAAILADIGDAWEHEANRAKLVRWYWNGVFGELYGSAVETRIARDFIEVPVWLEGGPEPSTVSETLFRADRLKTIIKPNVFDSIINKTPLSYRTNRIIGGVAPSEYIAKLEKGDHTTPPIDREKFDAFLTSHQIDPSLLRADNFDGFMVDRQKRLLALIEQATGKAPYTGTVREEGEDVEADPDTVEAELTTATA
jgi:hypothetical protein